uniref:Uncharacterized protein n=1 Tax=Arundo donax TaxID=35708 RepID=A0A0A9A1V7_ARUDO
MQGRSIRDVNFTHLMLNLLCLPESLVCFGCFQM